MVGSRWPWRFLLAAAIRRVTSASVRYPRARVSALRLRRGGFGRSLTVPITVGGATSVKCGFVIIFRGFPRGTVPNIHGTLHKAGNADFINTTSIRRDGKIGSHARDAELAG